MSRESIGQRLIELRGDKRREDVAKALSISLSALQMYENGKRMPRYDIMEKIATYYGVSVLDIFFEKE